MAYYIGAYAAAPMPFDPALEDDFYRGLRTLGARGLELPFFGPGFHAARPDGFPTGLDPAWTYLVTCLPGTMNSLERQADFGIASDSPSGRAAALAFLEQARGAVLRLNARLGRRAVRLVAVHSAPRQGAGVAASEASLAASLAELQGWDWDGAALAIEHCDAYTPGRQPEKGFLRLEQELAAIRATGGRTGMVINWARSAIEGRSAETPARHIALARDAGRLRGVVFSGCTADDPLYGQWRDRHAPFAPEPGAGSGCAASLLTAARAQECLRSAGAPRLDVLGIKINPLPASLTVERRLDRLRDAITIVDGCLREARR
jgi:hypothetical protein